MDLVFGILALMGLAYALFEAADTPTGVPTSAPGDETEDDTQGAQQSNDEVQTSVQTQSDPDPDSETDPDPQPICDPITGSDDANTAEILFGTDECDDTMSGRAGIDILLGGGGNDTLLGGEGTDFLLGGAGDDLIDLGSRGTQGGPSYESEMVLDVEGADTVIGADDESNIIVVGGLATPDLLEQEGGPFDPAALAQGGWLTPDEEPEFVLLREAFGVDPNTGTPSATFEAGSDDDAPDHVTGGDLGNFFIYGTGDTIVGGARDDFHITGDWIDPANPAIVEDFSLSAAQGGGEDALAILTRTLPGETEPLVEVTYAPGADASSGDAYVAVNGDILVILRDVGTGFTAAAVATVDTQSNAAPAPAPFLPPLT